MPDKYCCFKPAKWKRDEFPEHNFDVIDLEPFKDTSVWRRLNYVWLFGVAIFSVLLYVADLATVALLIKNWVETGLQVPTSYEFCQSGNSSTESVNRGDYHKTALAVNIIIIASVVISYIILAWDIYKAHRIIKSKSISFAITSTVAYRYYSIKSYLHFCLFQRIMRSTKLNMLAFFAYFELKDWKRLLFAESPRRGVAIYLMVVNVNGRNFFQTLYDLIRNPNGCGEDDNNLRTKYILMILLLFTTLVFLIHATLFLAALGVYARLVCIIQGNLKEYCCHLIDKRIASLIRKQVLQKQQMVGDEDRVDKNAIENLRSAIEKSKGSYPPSNSGSERTRYNLSSNSLNASQPTLPNVGSPNDSGSPILYQYGVQSQPNQVMYPVPASQYYGDSNAFYSSPYLQQQQQLYSAGQVSSFAAPAVLTNQSPAPSTTAASSFANLQSVAGQPLYPAHTEPIGNQPQDSYGSLAYNSRFNTFFSSHHSTNEPENYPVPPQPNIPNRFLDQVVDADSVYPDDSVSQVEGSNRR